jgi:hypothetical protein
MPPDITLDTQRSERYVCSSFLRVYDLTEVMQISQNPHQNHKPAVTWRKRTRNPKNDTPNERRKARIESQALLQTESHKQAKIRKRPQEDEAPLSGISPEPSSKRARTSLVSASEPVRWKSTIDYRVDHWNRHGTWPTEEVEGRAMDRFREIFREALPRKRSSSSLRRKRSDASINTATTSTRTPSDQQPREQKSAPYKHPRYEGQLKERGSFMHEYSYGIVAKSRELCQKLLRSPQSLPKETLFEDGLFKKTLMSVKSRNEPRVVRDIAPLIVPPAEILAIRGATHLDILRETINAGWTNALPFCGPRPQPDYGLGFKREAFTSEQLQKLQPFIGNELEDTSWVAATYDMYFPFLTSQVKCGASALDIADRQNAHSQTVALRNLIMLFRLMDRENELHQEICGFSVSHSDVDVRIWGHYPVIDGTNFTFYREPIAEFNISPTADGDQRWKAYTFIRNVYDIWVPEHFERICSVIDMIPIDLDFEVSELSILGLQRQSSNQDYASSRSGLSQQRQEHDVDERTIPDSQPITPDTTIPSISTKRKKP